MATARPGTWKSLRLALGNRRIATVALQSFASGLPLGLVWIAIPAWLKYQGADIRTIGLFSLAQAPWNFKFLWAPLLDRYSPPFLGRKRSWMLLMELALIASIAALAVEALDPNVSRVFVIGLLIAFSSASLDVVVDGYAVESLEKDEQGKAVGARVAMYRVAMYLSGGLAITAGERWGWPVVFSWIAGLFFPMLVVVVWSKEPPGDQRPPTSLRAAVVDPMLGMFKKARALEVLSFIVLFKLGENLATALIRPFLIEKGFTPEDIGIVVTTVNFFATVTGTISGGVLTDRIGMGRTLWLAGILQALGCLAYVVVDQVGGPTSDSLTDPHRLFMYAAVGAEQCFQGMGGGALGVLMLRLTAKEFSSTQFALLSSLMALPRVIVGPFAGVLAYSLGWSLFFVITVPLALPGLLMLTRFVPFFARDAHIDDVAGAPAAPVTKAGLAGRGALAFVCALAVAGVWSALLSGMADSRKAILAAKSFAEVRPLIGDNITAHALALVSPATPAQWVDLVGPFVFAVLVAGAACALVATRRGVAGPDRPDRA